MHHTITLRKILIEAETNYQVTEVKPNGCEVTG